MNEDRLSGSELEKALAERLRELLGKVAWLSGWKVERNPAPYDRAFDLLATLPLPNKVEAELWGGMQSRTTALPVSIGRRHK